MKPKAIIVDLDGCLFDHRQYDKYLPVEKSEQAWEEYHRNVNYYRDMPVNQEVLDIVKSFAASKHRLIFITARLDYGDIWRNTIVSLRLLFPDEQQRLYMRPVGNVMPPEELKFGLYQLYVKRDYDVVFAIDDSEKVIDMYQKEGLTTMLFKKKAEVLV